MRTTEDRYADRICRRIRQDIMDKRIPDEEMQPNRHKWNNSGRKPAGSNYRR